MENQPIPPQQPQQAPVITIDGKQYQFADLPPDVQRLVIFYNNWNVELEKAVADLRKLEYAIQQVSTQIGAEMKKVTDPAPDIKIG